MQRVLPMILLCVICFGLHAQISKKRADKYKESFSYAKAIPLYKDHIEKNADDFESTLNLAECYVKINDPLNAVRTYMKVEGKSEFSEDHLLNFARMLEQVKDYKKSVTYYEKYKSKVGHDQRADEKINGIPKHKELYKGAERYVIFEFEHNSTEIDFAPAFYKQGIVFSSARENGVKMIKNNFSWNMKSFLDLYNFQEGDTTVSEFDANINSKYHEGAIAFDPISGTAFFTRNNYLNGKKRESSAGVNKIKLYQAKQGEDGSWTNIEELHFDSDEYSIGDPYYYAPEKALYFASDMPGGQGGLDLYKTIWSEDKWSEPINLGKEINSEGNERSPYLLEDGRFFFASDGHAGLGGLDVYVVNHFNKGKTTYQNMGYPLNSNLDDFGLILKEESNAGYFVSNRGGGTGMDDIYRIEITATPKITLNGNVYVRQEDQTEKDRVQLEGAEITVLNEDGEIVKQFRSDADGKFKASLDKGMKYTILAEKDTLSKDQLIYNQVDEEETEKNIELTLVALLPDPISVVLIGNVVDLKTSRALDSTSIYVLNKNTGEVNFLKTDEQGRFKMALVPENDYVIKGTRSGYLANCIRFKTPKASRENHKTTVPLILEKIQLNRVFKIENVYFDVAKWNIRPDAAKELDKVARFLLENPSIQVELGSHTDSRGSDSYNQSLSEKRARSSVEYIVTQGVSQNNISYKGYGEEQLTNSCKNGVKCSKEQHQANRRTEIKITGLIEEVPTATKANLSNTEALDPKGYYGYCQKVEVVKQ